MRSTMKVLTRCTAALVVWGLAVPALPQEPSAQTPQTTIKSEVGLVNLFATVRDKKKHILTDLKKEDFHVFENDEEQKIAFFSKETTLPITMGLLIDTSRSEENRLPAEQEADVRLSLAAMFAISADDRADNARQGLSLTGLSADTRARLWASLFHNLMVGGRLEEGLAIESEVRANVFASTDLAARYFFQIGRSAMEYQLGRFEPSLRLLQGVDPERLAGFDDPRERLTHSYRSWLLSALDRVDEATAVAEDGLASAQRDRQNWAVHVFETWRGRHLLHLGRLDEANAVLEGRFHLADAHLIVGVLDAASVVALGRTKLHIGDERGAHEVAEIAKVMLTTTAPVVRRHAAWYLAVHAMTAGDPDQAHRWLCALGETERLSLFPLFPMEVADDPLLVRMALAGAGLDQDLMACLGQLLDADRDHGDPVLVRFDLFRHTDNHDHSSLGEQTFW